MPLILRASSIEVSHSAAGAIGNRDYGYSASVDLGQMQSAGEVPAN
jgi:hypothetical protein